MMNDDMMTMMMMAVVVTLCVQMIFMRCAQIHSTPLHSTRSSPTQRLRKRVRLRPHFGLRVHVNNSFLAKVTEHITNGTEQAKTENTNWEIIFRFLLLLLMPYFGFVSVRLRTVNVSNHNIKT